MPLTCHDECPLCNALVSYTMTQRRFACPYCGNELLVGSSDPTGHYLSEIDPDISGGAFGVFHLNLHAVGTHVCVICQQIYPQTFECCPQLVDLAFASFDKPKESWTPHTQQRIEAFLRDNQKVVQNTAQLRLIQAKYGEVDSKIANRIRRVLKSLNLLDWIAELDPKKDD